MRYVFSHKSYATRHESTPTASGSRPFSLYAYSRVTTVCGKPLCSFWLTDASRKSRTEKLTLGTSPHSTFIARVAIAFGAWPSADADQRQNSNAARASLRLTGSPAQGWRSRSDWKSRGGRLRARCL